MLHIMDYIMGIITLKELDAVREYMKWLEGGIPNA